MGSTLNILLDRLARGDLRTDGEANEVVRDVRAHPELLELLLEGLTADGSALRGHAADALEKVSRTHPVALSPHLPLLLDRALYDPVAMVRWHLAMILGTLGALGEQTEDAVSALLELSNDSSAFVRSWAVSGLAVIGLRDPAWRQELLPPIAALLRDRSIAVRTRAAKALAVLEGRDELPTGWVKCKALQEQLPSGRDGPVRRVRGEAARIVDRKETLGHCVKGGFGNG